MSTELLLGLSPCFYEKQVIHTWLDIVFPVAHEVYPVYGAYLGMIHVKRALAMQHLPPSNNPTDDAIRVVSVLIGRPTLKPSWTARIDADLKGPVRDANAVLLRNLHQGAVPPEEMQVGELLVLDPRVLVLHQQSRTVLYNPRLATAERYPFDGFMALWMRRNRDWPEMWIHGGGYPEDASVPFPGFMASDRVSLEAAVTDPDGDLLDQRFRRSVPGTVLMEGQ